MAKEIGAILEGAGCSYIVQLRNFRVGTNFVLEMQRRLAASWVNSDSIQLSGGAPRGR
jgi:hypothetical protein